MSNQNIETAFPLSPLQEGMLYHTIRHPDSSLYRGQCTAELSGPIDDALFQRAWALAAERHQAFRTFFAWERRERPLQVVRERVDLPWSVVDWSTASPEEQEARWQQLIASDRAQPFDLVSAPLMRFVLIHLADDRHRLLWSLHHALADGWSGMLVMRDVVEDYSTLCAGDEPDRPSPPSYATFLTWLGARDAGAAEAYWRKQLAGFVEPTPLPGAQARNPGRARATTEVVLDVGATPALQSAAARLRVTPNTLAVGAWALVLDRYTAGARDGGDAAGAEAITVADDDADTAGDTGAVAGSNDVSFGVTISERPPEIPGVDRSVGLYLNTVPVRVGVRADEPLSEWLADLQCTLSDGRDQSAGGLAEIQRWSELERKTDLVRSLVVYESFPADVVAPGVEGTLRIDTTTISAPSDLPLAFLVYPDERLTLQLVYDPSLYDEASAKRLLEEASRALMALTSATGARGVGDIDILGAETRATLLEDWSGANAPLPPATDVLTLFEAKATEFPAAPAVRAEGTELTYGALNQAAEALAGRIAAVGLEPGSLLGIPAVRDIDTVVALLAALKAGHAYTLIAVDQPGPRMRGVLEGVDRVVPVGDAGRNWDRAIGPSRASGGATDRAPVSTPEESIAYVMWTSGSTGTPKGVVVERGHLARSTSARLAYYGPEPERFLLLSLFSVDSAVAGIFGTLCTGGCLVIPAHRAEQDIGGVARLIEEESITATLLVPSLYAVLLEEADTRQLATLRRVIVAGDACPPHVVALHRERMPQARLFNEYGPSEATVWASVADLTDTTGAQVTIGRPVPFVRAYLLDVHGRLVPPGAAGEICLGGDMVARGYLTEGRRVDGRPRDGRRHEGAQSIDRRTIDGRAVDRQAVDRFVDDPFRPGKRMYRTGDSGRFLPDGRLEFLGRIDDQMKIRGFRVEPAEIEIVLESDPDVGEAAVVLETSTQLPDTDSLVRMLVEEAGADAEALLDDLLERHS